MRTLLLLLVVLALMFGTPVPLRAADPSTLDAAFQGALLAEEARRDLDAAIRGYEEIVARIDAQRAIAATTIFRLGECHRKVGRTNDAVVRYERLLRDYPGEGTLGRLSRENLLALGAAPVEDGPTERVAEAYPPSPRDPERQEIQRLRSLFDRSPDLLDATSDGLTPLLRAANVGQLAVVRALIGWGADVHRAAAGDTPLHAAAGAGHKASREPLLRESRVRISSSWMGATVWPGRFPARGRPSRRRRSTREVTSGCRSNWPPPGAPLIRRNRPGFGIGHLSDG